MTQEEIWAWEDTHKGWLDYPHLQCAICGNSATWWCRGEGCMNRLCMTCFGNRSTCETCHDVEPEFL